MKKFVENILLTVILFALAACSPDSYDLDQNSGDGGNVRVRLIAPAFNVTETRAMLTEEEEFIWNNVWVAQFDNAGDLVGVIGEFSSSVGNFSMDVTPMNGTTLYFVTNVTDNPFLKQGGAPGELVSSLSDFASNLYAPTQTYPGDLIGSDGALVMTGQWTGDIVGNSQNISDIVVYAERAAAKISLVIKVNQTGYANPSFQTISFTASEVSFHSLPKQMSFVPGYKAVAESDVDDLPAQQLTLSSGSTGEVLEYIVPPFYVLENMQGADLGNGNTDHSLKNGFAPSGDIASYFLIKGYIDDLVNRGPVEYKIYLGGDASTNFDIQRNTNYKITVTLAGAAIENVDMRVDRSLVFPLQLQRLNGSYATNRASETRAVSGESLTWGNLLDNATGSTAPPNSQDHLKVYAGTGQTWGFRMEMDIAGWTPRLYIMRDGATTWEITGTDIDPFTASGLPDNARIMIDFDGKNTRATKRQVRLFFWNDSARSAGETFERRWVVEQNPSEGFAAPTFAYFPSDAGTYAVPIRGSGANAWKPVSISSGASYFEIIGVYDQDGNAVADHMNTYVGGHGTVIIRALTSNTSTVPGINGTLRLSVTSGDGFTTVNIPLMQIAPTSVIAATVNTNARWMFHYSSHPYFESLIPWNGSGVKWATNMLEEGHNYYNDESLVGALDPSTGRTNTALIFNAVDKFTWSIIPDGVVDALPVITPAGVCALLNAENGTDWQNLTTGNSDNLEWYMPARVHAIMDATGMMLSPGNAGTNARPGLPFFSSTSSTASYYAGQAIAYSAFKGGTTVDVSNTSGDSHPFRCIRDIPKTKGDKTYPYIKRVDNKPVIVVREEVDGVTEGYNDPSYSTTSLYKVDRAKRFTAVDLGFGYDGSGPTDYDATTVSPAFQVALKDAQMYRDNAANMVSTGPWVAACGWNSDATDMASPRNGCQAYTETGQTSGWRVPTEMEMRLIGLLGGGQNNYVPDFTAGGEAFTDFEGFTRLGGNYWTNRRWPEGGSYPRSAYVSVTTGTDLNPIAGTATAKGNNNRVRCVRDVYLQ